MSRTVNKYKKCCKCGSNETYIRPSGYPCWFMDYNDKGDWTGKYVCHKCYHRYDNNSTDNLIKSMRKCRNKGISKYSNTGKGFIGEQIVANVRGLKNCNIEKDDFNFKFDLHDPEYGRVQVKTHVLNREGWSFSNIKLENYDTIILLCMDEYRKNIERVYIIPSVCVVGPTGITIVKYPSRGFRYEKFRVDERPYNDSYHSMKLDNCPVLKDE